MQNFIYHRKDPNTGEITQEKVAPRVWRWEAEYYNGSIFQQYEPALTDPLAPGIFHQIAEIDQHNLKAFHIVNEETKQRLIMLFPPKAKLVMFYRQTIYNGGTPNEIRAMATYFGYELPHYHMFFIIMDDKTIIISQNKEQVQIT